MFTLYISKEFIENIYSDENRQSSLFDIYVNDFFPKLNISTLISDFDISDITDDNIKRTLKSLMKDGVPFDKIIINEKLETKIKENTTFLSTDNIPSFKKLLFLHLNDVIIKNFNHIKNYSYISSLEFEKSFVPFLIQGKIENACTLSEFNSLVNYFNPLICNSCNVVIIDDTYFLKEKDGEKGFDALQFQNQLKLTINNFLLTHPPKKFKLILLIPGFNHTTKTEKWTLESKDEVNKIAKELCRESFPLIEPIIYFHKILSHSRRIMSNKHFYRMDTGFDFIKSTKEKLEETNDGIDFKSIYLKNRIFQEYFENRFSKTKCTKHII